MSNFDTPSGVETFASFKASNQPGHDSCGGYGTGINFENPINISLVIQQLPNGRYALVPVANVVPQPAVALPLLVEYDTEGQVVLLSLPIDGIPNL